MERRGATEGRGTINTMTTLCASLALLLPASSLLLLLLTSFTIIAADNSISSTRNCDETKCRHAVPFTSGTQDSVPYSCWITKEGNGTDVAAAELPCAEGYVGRLVPNVTRSVESSSSSNESSPPSETQFYYTCCLPGYNGPVSKECSTAMCLPSPQCWEDTFLLQNPCTVAIAASGKEELKPYIYPYLIDGIRHGFNFQFTCCKYSDGGGQMLPIDQYTNYCIVYLCLGFLVISLNLVMIVSILLSKETRSQAFNVYVIFLYVPSLFLNGYFIVTVLVKGQGNYPPSRTLGAASFFYYSANLSMNTVIAHEIWVLLRNSKVRRRTNPPPLDRVYKQVAVVYLVAVVYGVWSGFFKFGHILDEDSPLYLVVLTLTDVIVLLPPFIYFIYIFIHIWRNKLLPITGKTRVLAVFFLRIAVVFVIVWIPFFVYEVLVEYMDKTFSASGFFLLFVLAVGEIVSFALVTTKPDVRDAIIHLLSCKFGCKSSAENSETRMSPVATAEDGQSNGTGGGAESDKRKECPWEARNDWGTPTNS